MHTHKAPARLRPTLLQASTDLLLAHNASAALEMLPSPITLHRARSVSHAPVLEIHWHLLLKPSLFLTPRKANWTMPCRPCHDDHSERVVEANGEVGQWAYSV